MPTREELAAAPDCQATHPGLTPADIETLDLSIRLYTTRDLADLAGVTTRTVERHIADPDNPLRYTHLVGKAQGLRIDYARARIWIDHLRLKS